MTALFGIRAQDGKAAAPGLLALALAETFGLGEIPRLERLPGGKPCFPDRPEIHFNLSHSGPWPCARWGTPRWGRMWR